MSRDQHEKLLEVFAAAFELPPPERTAVLDRACGDDEHLRREVESMLAEHDQQQSTRFLETPALGEQFNVQSDVTHLSPDARLVGAQIGRYRLKRIIASGGMGTVYEGVQERPHRTVAIKVMKRGVTSRSALRRFEYESQILARLRHPGIAQIYEAGSYDDGSGGLPYFVMEYIAGARPITVYAREHNLSMRDRLALFEKVCDAVHHGHQRGIIHRDLKPENILVDGDGSPKIIDFGVARTTDADMAVTTLQTDIGQLIGTLQYMSPEQCAADPHDIDTRSDVYALGVVLYELLCGQLPYDVHDVALHEAVRVIQESPPTRPGHTNRSLRGELETITLKALEKERSRRYESAADLGQDLRRYLNHEPIVARPPSAIYQMRKFARRNRALVAGAGAVFFVLVLGLIGTTWQARQAEAARLAEVEQREKAEREAAIKTSVYEFMHETLTNFSGAEREMTVREMLDRAAATIETHYRDQPLVEAEVRDMIQAMYERIGRYDLAEPHARRMLEVWRDAHGTEHEKTIGGMGRLAWILQQQGRAAEGEPMAQAAYETALRMYGPEHALTFQGKNNLAMNWWAQGRLAEAEAQMQELVASYRRFPERDDATVATYLNNLGLLLDNSGHPEDAIPYYREALELQRGRPDVEPAQRASALWNLGRSLRRTGDLEGATHAIKESFELRRQHLGDTHPLTHDTFIELTWLYELHESQSEFERAIELYKEFLAVQIEEYGEESVTVAETMHHYGEVLYQSGRIEEAEPAVRRALEIYLGQPHAPPNEFRHTVEILYTILLETGTADDRIDLLENGLIYQRDNVEPGHIELHLMCALLAHEYLQQDRFAEAEPLAREAFEIREHHLGGESWFTLNAMSMLGATLTGLERYREAEPMLVESAAALAEHPEAPSARRRGAIERVIELYERWDRPDDAAQWRGRLTASDR